MYRFPGVPQGSLKIYDPPKPPISKTFFEYDQRGGKVLNYHPRENSLIDQLENKAPPQNNNREEYIGSDNNLHPTSIQFLVEQREFENKISKDLVRIGDIFANKPALSSRQIASPLLFSTKKPQLTSVNSNQVLLQSFPSKEYITDSPQRPNLSRPFLRKKPTSKSSDIDEQDPTSQIKKDQHLTFEQSKLQAKLNNLKTYNSELWNVVDCLTKLGQKHRMEWSKLKKSEKQLLKLLIQKQIISKEQCR